MNISQTQINTTIIPKLDRADSTDLERELPPKVEFVITIPTTEKITSVTKEPL
ncbi:hypothetical protein BDV97DRAFT_357347 [Delphinella strobiligena]|nr:hypothetical protein BDV97DRAFT_357347 [Delphinella strobiligena]